LSFTCAENLYTVWGISSIEILKKRDDLLTPILQKDTSIAFLCDSWGEFPSNIGGDTPVLRADGTTAIGQMYLSEHLNTYLTSKGYLINTYNASFGGQTSAWGKYWLKSLILDLPNKPKYCVINFSINDSNSYAITGDSVYDFDATNPYLNKVQSLGGVKGSVTAIEWFENMKYISDTLISNNIKPIIITPPFTAGVRFDRIEQYLTYLTTDFSK